MRIKTACAIVIVCLSVGAMITLTSDLWMHRLSVMGVQVGWISFLAGALQVGFFYIPLILFFVVLYRHESNAVSSR